MLRKATILIVILLVAGTLTQVSGNGLTLARARELALSQSTTLQKALSSVDAAKLNAKLQSYAMLPAVTASASGSTTVPSASFGSSLGESAGLSVEQAQQNIKLATAGYLPTVSMSVAGTTDFSGTLQGSTTVSMSVPLDVWNVAAEVSSQRIAAKQVSLTQSESRKANALAIEQAVYDTVASAQAAGASQQAFDYAERCLQSIQEQYKLATASSADLSDAAQLLSDDRSLLISARYQFLSDLSNLRTLVGSSEDDLLEKLNT